MAPAPRAEGDFGCRSPRGEHRDSPAMVSESGSPGHAEDGSGAGLWGR